MKRFSLILAFSCIAFSSNLKAFEPVSMSLAAAIALPLAKVAWNGLVSAYENKGCTPECYQGTNYCTKGVSYRNYRECKGACQRIVQHGDYQLRVRFAKDQTGSENSLLNCVQRGAKASGRDELGKEKKSRAVELQKSIAVYNEHDLEIVLFLILEHKQLKIFRSSDEKFLSTHIESTMLGKEQISKLRKDKETDAEFFKRLKDDAEVQMGILEGQIESLRKAGLFGPQ